MADINSITPLTIKSNLQDMEIGDCIPCKYTALASGEVGYFDELGRVLDGTESFIPYESSATPDGYFYFIKVDNGTLIADRNVQHSISWNKLNKNINYVKIVLGKVVSDETSDYKFTSDSVYNNTVYAYKAFDDNKNTYWHSESNNSKGFLQIEFKNKKVKVNRIELSSNGNNVTHFPVNFNIEASNDGVNYTILKSIIGFSSTRNSTYSFDFKNNTEYSFYKINIFSTTSDIAKHCSIAEVELFEKIENDYLITLPTGGVTYMDANGQPSTTNQKCGGWSLENDWDKYIVNSDLNGKIIAGDNDIWHYDNLVSWTVGLPVLTMGHLSGGSTTISSAITRGYVDTFIDGVNPKRMNYSPFTHAIDTHAFRPMLKYVDEKLPSSKRPSTLFY